MQNMITLIRSIQPDRVCKDFVCDADGTITKTAVAHVSAGTAKLKAVPNATAMIELLKFVTERHDVVVVPGIWHNSDVDQYFRIITEAALKRSLKPDPESWGGVHQINGENIAARLKCGIDNSTWVLLDADNPVGMPDEWCNLTIAERLEMWEPMLPGITVCERIELRSSSARVVKNGDQPGNASHAWIRVSDPKKVDLLRTHIRVHMSEHKASFISPLFSRKTGEQIGGAYRSVFDLAVFDAGRLVFCAKPTFKGEGYSVVDANITLVNEGAGPLDLGHIKEPSAKAVVAMNKRDGSRLEFKASKSSGNLVAYDFSSLSLKTPITVRGEEKILADWLLQMAETGTEKLRCEAPFRASESEASFIRQPKDGDPFVYDIGEGTVYFPEEYAQENKPSMNIPMGRYTNEVCDAIDSAFEVALGSKTDLTVNRTIINAMLETSFMDPKKNKVLFLNREGGLVEFGKSECWQFLCRTFGHPVSYGDVVTAIERALPDETPKKQESNVCVLLKKVAELTLENIFLYRQRTALSWRVDMFATEARFELLENYAEITIPHKEFQTGPYDQAIVDDFDQHFPELEEMLNFIVASRFAPDRKKSFLWWRATSDFGKGFVTSIMKDLGIVVETSVKEVETLMEGKAVGLSADAFKRAMVLFVDEFKNLKSEIKQLQSHIELSPKFQLRQRVEIYTKLFASAENVASLVTQEGIEDQFANRMSYIECQGTLDGREKYQHVGSAKYFDSMKNWVAQYMNAKIADYIAMGPEQAADAAMRSVTAYHGCNSIGKRFGRISDNLEGIAEEFRKAMLEDKERGSISWDAQYFVSHQNEVIMARPKKALAEWLKRNFDYHECNTLSRKMDQLLELASVDGRGHVQRKVFADDSTRTAGVADKNIRGIALTEPDEVHMVDIRPDARGNFVDFPF